MCFGDSEIQELIVFNMFSLLAQVESPADFLKSIGRGSETKFEAPEKWEDFWKVDGNVLKKANVPVADRR